MTLFATICHYLPLFATIRDCSPLCKLLEVIRSIRTIRYSLFAIRYSLFAIRYSLFAIRYSLFAIRYSLFAIRYSLFAIRYSLFATIRYSLFAIRYSLFAIRYSLFGTTRCSLFATIRYSLIRVFHIPQNVGLRGGTVVLHSKLEHFWRINREKASLLLPWLSLVISSLFFR